MGDVRLFRAGGMSIENVTAKGYSACPSFNWLKVNGSPEGRFEAQSGIIENPGQVSEAVSEAIKIVQSGWIRNEFFQRKRMRTEGDERDESPIRLISRTVLRIPLSQSST